MTEFHNDYYDDAGTDGAVAAVKVNYVYTAAEMKRVFDLVCMNHPEFFWLAKNYTYTTRSTYTTMNYYAVSEYADGEVRNDDKNSLDTHVANCIRLLAGERDEYSMIKVVHDYICDTTKYAYDENGGPLRNSYTPTPVGALVKKSAICEGYSEAFQLILRECGIKCANVLGMSEGTPGKPELHQWNAVLLDGKWYLVDTTWDAANDGETIYTYFLIGSDNLPHITDTEEQGQFWLPEISETDYVASTGEYDRFTVTTVAPDDGYIKLYNKSVEVESGTEVCEGTELTVKLVDSFYKFTVLLNGTAIEGESFVVEEDTEVSLLLSDCVLTGIELPYVKEVVASNGSPLAWREDYTDIYTDTGFTDYAYIEWNLTDYNAKKTSDGMPYDFVSTGTLELPGGVTATPEQLTLVRNVHVKGYYRQPNVEIPYGYVLEITDKDGNVLNGSIEYGTEIYFNVKDFS